MKRHPEPAATMFQAYIELTKPKITFMILISTALGYYIGGEGVVQAYPFILTLFGTAIVSGGAGTLNHYTERDLDMLMERTCSRPIPAGIIGANTALTFGLVQVLFGLTILLLAANLLTAFLALLTAFLYIFVYTPLKRITWLNTTIGAVPGALPPMGGWAAATGNIDFEAWILFAILFLWQHPHFYAIALMCKDDYMKAGFKMLPVLENDGRRTNRQIIWHAFLLIPISVMPVYAGILGPLYLWGALIFGIIYLTASLPLIRNYSIKNAKLLLKVSVLYLPCLLGLILVDYNI